MVSGRFSCNCLFWNCLKKSMMHKGIIAESPGIFIPSYLLMSFCFSWNSISEYVFGFVDAESHKSAMMMASSAFTVQSSW